MIIKLHEFISDPDCLVMFLVWLLASLIFSGLFGLIISYRFNPKD